MYRFLLAASLLISAISSSQDTDKLKQDSLNKIVNSNLSYSDSVQRAEDIKRMTDRSVSYFAQLQKQRNARQRKQAILYIVIGAVFLIVLIVGLRRRRKK